MKTFTKFMAIAASVVSCVGIIAILRLPLTPVQMAIESALICSTIAVAYIMVTVDPEKGLLEVIDAERA